MTNYYASARKGRTDAYRALLADQARTSDEQTELEEFDADVQAVPHALVMADQPAPARGYSLIFGIGDELVGGRLHVLAGQPVEVYRALFSQTLVQARLLANDHQLATVVIDAASVAEHVAAAIADFGSVYGIFLNTAVEEITDSTGGDEETGHLVLINYDDAATAAPATEDDELIDDEPEPVETLQREPEEQVEAAPEAVEIAELPPLEEVTDADLPFGCAECGKGFATKQGLGAHSRTHKS